MGQIDGQVAIVVGGGSGVGEGIARRFAREGAALRILDLDGDAAVRVARDIVASGGTASGHRTALADEGAAARETDAAMRELGRIDILVNAQFPLTPWARLESKDTADFATVLDTAVIGAVRAMQAVYPHMRVAGGGRIVNVGSPYGSTAHESITDAVTADGALAALSRAAGFEWAQHGILVNYLQTAAPDIPAFRSYRGERGEIVDELVANTPLGRTADPIEDVGGAAMFLVSDEACFVVGHRILADGGQHLTSAAFEPGMAR